MDTFFKYWFKGLENGLCKMDEAERGKLLKECAVACSRSHSLAMYQEAYNESKGLEDFLQNMKRRFPELNYVIGRDGGTVAIIYDHCACDLYKTGCMSSGFLCDCSRHSLQYNLESVMGKGKVEVVLKQSILRGQDTCILEVRLK